ncbi:cell wall protein DAN4-like isoform X2 [Pararge aegeria]|uniref:cell wall protein DAN4-like isoform X2 n=1 Tax=Pararge aegeria TaxID=116150 RepID=UPI0019D09B0F|nr:cell wall protein DAN4-like isoform X2 [Pararge aegeria]
MRLYLLTSIACAMSVCKCTTKWPDPIKGLAYLDNPVESGFPGHWLPINLIKRIMETRARTLEPNVDKFVKLFHVAASKKPLSLHQTNKKNVENTHDVMSTKSIVNMSTSKILETVTSKMKEIVPKIAFVESLITEFTTKNKNFVHNGLNTTAIHLSTSTHLVTTELLTKVSSPRGANPEESSEVVDLNTPAELHKDAVLAVPHTFQLSSLEGKPTNMLSTLSFYETVTSSANPNPTTSTVSISTIPYTTIDFTTNSTEFMSTSESVTSMMESTISFTEDTTSKTEFTITTTEPTTRSTESITSTNESTTSTSESTTSSTESSISTTESTTSSTASTISTTETTMKSTTVLTTLTSPTTTKTMETGNPFY